jgi:ribosomal protein L29
MATRPAGSGVLVTLVTFVITTVAFLVLAVVFYSQMMSATEMSDKSKKDMTNLKAELATAKKPNDEALALYKQTATERDALKLTASQQEKSIQGTAKTIDELNSQLTAVRKSLADATTERQAAIDAAKKDIAPLTNATTEYDKSIEDVQKITRDSKDDVERNYRARIDEMQLNIDGLGKERDTLRSRLEQAEKKLSEFEVKPEDPSSLVDGHVIEIGGPDATVYLDIGRKHRVVPGMTFEVFTTADQVQNNKQGKLRGKASVQVLRVTEDTSTARVTRSSANQPINRNDVLINAVYSPTYTYRMMVYGKFDVNNDGKASTGEASVIRNRIQEWGGKVIDSEKVTGDLDFVVMGNPPPEPLPLSSSAGDIEVQAYIQAKNDYDTYNRIMKEATEAKIPVLNWNRFQVLTGQGN